MLMLVWHYLMLFVAICSSSNSDFTVGVLADLVRGAVLVAPGSAATARPRRGRVRIRIRCKPKYKIDGTLKKTIVF